MTCACFEGVAKRQSAECCVATGAATGNDQSFTIHLAAIGHPVCGDKVYGIRRDGTEWRDESGSPRLFLHAAELGFRHPVTKQEMRWEMKLPADLEAVLRRMMEAS